ncbi:MAG TPA: LpqB family beta-propeller domain-containing protein [Microbacteriaceae bacterium]|nr:LpqB family beta-propeller domain-containing protein [Microbacteriaceae bacterium]
MRSRRLLRTLVAFASIALLGGCASIPTSGGVNAGITFESSSGVELDILARGPQEGDSPQQILEGFLAAAASPQLDYRIAREFLTPSFSKIWKPDAGTTVDAPLQRSFDATSDASIALRVRPLATVGADGMYVASPAAAAETRNYTFAQVDGQWRMSRAPQGIVIDQSSFGIVFGAYRLQFFSADGRFFVPDVRWFARRETTQTAIVRALVAGPAPWLAPGVTTAIPAGAQLDSDSVPIVNGSASVNLAIDQVPDAQTLSRISAQIRSSLSGVSAITGLSLSVNGSPENPRLLVPSPQTEALVDARPAVMGDAGFGYLSNVSNQVEVDPTLSGAIAALGPDSIALGIGGAFAAVRSAVGISRVSASGTERIVSGAGWLAPAVDFAGGIWSSQEAGPMVWHGPDGSAVTLPVAWGNVALEAFAVSRDGARLAAVLQDGAVTRIVVAAVNRGAGGAPTSLGSPLPVTEYFGTGDAVGWADSSTIVVLGRSDTAAREVTFAQVGGSSSRAPAPPNALALATGNSSRELRILDAEGQILQSTGASWQVRANGIRVLATQIGLR